MRSLETTSGDLEQLRSWHLETTSGKWMRESFQRLQQLLEVLQRLLEAVATVGSWGNFWKLRQLLEVEATFGSWGNFWKLRRLLEAAMGYWQIPQYDGKCSFHFNCYFFHTTPTNQDHRQKAVYFPARVWKTISKQPTGRINSLYI